MKNRQWILYALIGIAILQWVHFYPMLPDRIAHQFDAQGNPVTWSPKLQLLWTLIGAECIVLLIFAGISRIAHRIPVSWWNLPNRDYWMADERKGRTIVTLREKLGWLGVFVLTFILLTNQAVINYNIPETERISIPDMFWITILFLILMGAWTLRLLRQFHR